jgi:hypothetical protein
MYPATSGDLSAAMALCSPVFYAGLTPKQRPDAAR